MGTEVPATFAETTVTFSLLLENVGTWSALALAHGAKERLVLIRVDMGGYSRGLDSAGSKNKMPKSS